MVPGIRWHTGADLRPGIPTEVCKVREARCSPRFLKRRTGLKLQRSDSEIAQSFPTLCDPRDCSLLAFSVHVHGILQARVLEWVAISFSRGSSRPRDFPNPGNLGLPSYRQTLYQLNHQGSPEMPTAGSRG